MYRPLSTVPFVLTSTSPSAATYFQPGPLDTWLGTEDRVVPLGTPVFVVSAYLHWLGVAEQLRPSAWAWPRAPTQTRTPTTAIAAAATTVTPYRRLRGPENPRPPDSGEPGPPGEPGGCRPMRIWLAEFRSVVMALPSVTCGLCCPNHSR